jgi:heterotetrameric sarcosine oxidase gamma subunit
MLESKAVSAAVETTWHIGALRYVDAAAIDAATLRLLGGALPPAGRALEAAGLVLAWRGPRETLILAPTGAALATLATALARAERACLVDQSQGYRAILLAGPRVPDLLVRLGSSDAVPAPGEARQGRLAELRVLALALADRSMRLIVERVYVDHLLGWIRATVADFEPDRT